MRRRLIRDERGEAEAEQPQVYEPRDPEPDGPLEPDEIKGAWHEPGSDELMDPQVLARVSGAALEAELDRARKYRRRGD